MRLQAVPKNHNLPVTARNTIANSPMNTIPTRRDFLKQTALATTALAAGSSLLRAAAEASPGHTAAVLARVLIPRKDVAPRYYLALLRDVPVARQAHYGRHPHVLPYQHVMTLLDQCYALYDKNQSTASSGDCYGFVAGVQYENWRFDGHDSFSHFASNNSRWSRWTEPPRHPLVTNEESYRTERQRQNGQGARNGT